MYLKIKLFQQYHCLFKEVWYPELPTFAYLALSASALASNLDLLVTFSHLFPSSLATSATDHSGCAALTSGRSSPQKKKNADLKIKFIYCKQNQIMHLVNNQNLINLF